MKSNNGHLASYWKAGNSAQERLTLSHMTQGASQWPWKQAQWDPGCLQLPWNMVKQWFKRRGVGWGLFGIEIGRKVRAPTQAGQSGNLSRHPARKSGQDNISKLRRTQTWKESLGGKPLSAPCFTSFFFSYFLKLFFPLCSPCCSSSLLQFLFPSLPPCCCVCGLEAQSRGRNG